MSHPVPALRGPLFMVLATGSYVVNDTMMKLATQALPPYETLVLRGIAASLWGMPLLFALGFGRQLRAMFGAKVLGRNLSETAAILCYVVALANMPIADATAIGQITPLIIILGAALAFGEPLGGQTLVLICCGFAGALLVAQPTGAGISIFALLAAGNAVMSAVRDLAGRRIAAEVPGMIVAMSAVVVVLVCAAAGHLLLEDWVAPGPRQLALLAGSGFFLIFGHFFIFMAYRVGSARLVAPFYYCFTLWAMVSGLLVFRTVPNALALTGIAIVIASGLAVLVLDGRRGRLAPVS